MKLYTIYFIVSLYSCTCNEACSEDNQRAHDKLIHEKLIHELGHEVYCRREAATAALIGWGTESIDLVVQHLNNADLEIEWRIRSALVSIAKQGQRQHADVVAALQQFGFTALVPTLEVRLDTLVQSFKTLLDENRYDEAEVVARKAAEQYPSSPVTHRMVWKVNQARPTPTVSRHRRGDGKEY